MNPDDIMNGIERLRVSGSDRPVESAVDRLLIPEFRARGLAAIRPLSEAAEARNDPRLWEVLVAFSDMADVPLLEVVPEQILSERCLRGLRSGHATEDEWAVNAVTHGELADDERWRIVSRLI